MRPSRLLTPLLALGLLVASIASDLRQRDEGAAIARPIAANKPQEVESQPAGENTLSAAEWLAVVQYLLAYTKNAPSAEETPTTPSVNDVADEAGESATRERNRSQRQRQRRRAQERRLLEALGTAGNLPTESEIRTMFPESPPEEAYLYGMDLG